MWLGIAVAILLLVWIVEPRLYLFLFERAFFSVDRSRAFIEDKAKHFPGHVRVEQHLDVLTSSGLVRSHKTGRVRTYELAPKPLKAAEDWMAKQRDLWERRLDQLDAYLLKMKEQEK